MPRKTKAESKDRQLTGKHDVSIRPFGRSLPMLLMLAREVVMERFRPHLRQHDMTEQQWRIVRVLAEVDAMDMLGLSSRTLILQSSLSRTIPLLAERGIVSRRGDSGDQRRTLVSLTPKGRRLFQVMSAESIQIYEALQADLGEERMAEIYRVLSDLVDVGAGDRREEWQSASEQLGPVLTPVP